MADLEKGDSAVSEEPSIKKIEVEVAYALPHEQVVQEVMIKAGGTVSDAIKHSGILVTYPEIDLAVNKVGVFGKITKMDRVLRAGDRVEIYRPLIADPKEVRRKRAAEGKRMKKGGGDITDGAAKPAKKSAAAEPPVGENEAGKSVVPAASKTD